MYRTVFLILFTGVVLLALGCGSNSSIAHKDPLYANPALVSNFADLGKLDLANSSADEEVLLTALDGAAVFRFATDIKAKIRVSVATSPGAHDIHADIWVADGQGYIAPIEEWASDWTVFYEGTFEPNALGYDIVVIPTNNTAGNVNVVVEIMERLPE